MTRLALLDGPAMAAVRDQLVAVYRAAMGAAPLFHETEVETGWFAEELAGEVTEAGFRCWAAYDDDGQLAGFAYGFPTPKVPVDGWYDSLREAVGPDAAERWLTGQFAVVWIAVHPDRPDPGSRHLQSTPVLGTSCRPRPRLPKSSRPGVPHPNPPLLGPLLGG
jgi:hypothetical protein